jgi:hypothetical protein
MKLLIGAVISLPDWVTVGDGAVACPNVVLEGLIHRDITSSVVLAVLNV